MVGRDPRSILRSGVMPVVITSDRAAVGKVERAYMTRLGADEAKARDTVLGGTVAEIKDKLAALGLTLGMTFESDLLETPKDEPAPVHGLH